ncbi:MAG: hypothetical protein ACREFL_05470 [Stellaceae bacterium]
MIGRGSFRFSGFALLCILWIAASVLLPLLGFFDSVVFDDLAFAAVWLLLPFLWVLSAGGDPSTQWWILPGLYWFGIAVWAFIPLVALAIALRALRQDRIRRSILYTCVPVAAVTLFLIGREGLDIFRFRLHQSAYDEVVAQIKSGACPLAKDFKSSIAVDEIGCNPVTIMFPWHVVTLLGNSWRGVVYDASDEIAKPPSGRSQLWQRREIGNALSCSHVDHPLGDHYYLASGDYAVFPGCLP